MIKPKDYSLGEVLIKMGTITQDQLEAALRFQREEEADSLLGNLLVQNKSCTAEHIAAAIAAQVGLRSDSLTDQAMAAVSVAGHRRRVMRNANLDMIHQGARALRRVRGDEFTPVFGVNIHTNAYAKR